MNAAIHAHPTCKVGKLPAENDPRNLRFTTFIDTTKVQAPPLALNRIAAILAAIGGLGWYLNNILGCCTITTWAHLFRVWAWARGIYDVDFSDDAIVVAYSACGSYQPTKNAAGHYTSNSTDGGCSMTTVANYMRQTGLVDTKGRVHKIGVWMQVDHNDITQCQIAQFVSPLVACGMALPISAQNTSIDWDTDGSGGNQAPDSWGGHSLGRFGFDHDRSLWGTWNQGQWGTYNYDRRYVDEVIVAIPQEMIDGSVASPEGFLLGDIRNAMGQFR